MRSRPAPGGANAPALPRIAPPFSASALAGPALTPTRTATHTATRTATQTAAPPAATASEPDLHRQSDVEGTLPSLGRASRVARAEPLPWIDEGVLTPVAPFNSDDSTWRFGGDSLARARAAQRLMSDLALNAAGVALVLDLLDRITHLQAQLQHHNDR